MDNSFICNKYIGKYVVFTVEFPNIRTTPPTDHSGVVLGGSFISVAGGIDKSLTCLNTCESFVFFFPNQSGPSHSSNPRFVGDFRIPTLLNHASFGKDRLCIAVKLPATAEIIMLKILIAPFVLGILGLGPESLLPFI